MGQHSGSKCHAIFQLNAHAVCCASAGKGTVIYKNSDKYEGDWANDMRHGLGTLWLYRDGKYVVRYNGEWRADQPTVRTLRPEALKTYFAGVVL